MSHLCYCSAAFGNWGIVRMGTLVPECHMLFVCPYACGRHNSIGALRHGYKDRISYLFVESQDLAVGSIEKDLAASVDQILRELPSRPRVFLIYFSCVLYMIGFDWDAAIDELSEKHPDIAFRPCMMNPIAADKKPPVPAMMKTLCSLWEPSRVKTRDINLLGSYISLGENHELRRLLREDGGRGLRHFLDAAEYREYRSMGSSCLNLVIRPEGLAAAQAWSSSIPYLFLPVSYHVETVDEQYKTLLAALGIQADLQPDRERALRAVRSARQVIGDRPLAVDSSAVCMPFSLAVALREYGFTVSDIFAEAPVLETEKISAKKAKRAGIAFHSVSDPVTRERKGRLGRAEIAVGYVAGYDSGAPFAVDLMMDEGMFGYDGIIRLMEKLVQAVREPTALEAMIESYGLII